MASEFKLPELGDGIESAEITEIFVSVGDTVSAGDDVIEVATDKATTTVPIEVSGNVTNIVVSEGDTVPVGAVLLEIEAADGSAASAPEPAQTPPAAAPPTPEPVQPEPTPPEPAPVQAAPPEPAAAPLPPKPPAAAPPTPVAPPQPTAPASPQPVASAPAPVAAPASSPGRIIPAGPAIRRFAREVGVDLSQVSGTGEGGRITREDVLTVVRSTGSAARSAPTTPSAAVNPQPAQAAPPVASGATDVDDYGPIRVERMKPIRKATAAHMHRSWSDVPRVTNFDDADITDLESLRQSSKADYAAQGLKLTTMPFLIKAVATALKMHPAINASIDEENHQVIYKDYVNVGIAVDTDDGLLVPVMKDADTLTVHDTTRELAEMAGKVRGGQFAMNDLKGGTFTISNLGAIGGQYSTPIVNVPEVAILLVGRSRKLPVVMPDDSIQPRLMMPLSLSYDHRLVDGGTAARFLNEVIAYLEAPSRLLMAF